MTIKLYAGIGSRLTPKFILELMFKYAKSLGDLGYKLRSGGAKGADKEFESGTLLANREIFLEEHATPECIELSSKYHPAWDRCNDYAKRLHGRNAMILLGQNLDNPVDFVICYTIDGKDSGGTGQAMRIARAYNIPIYNLYHEIDQTKLNNLILLLREIRDNNIKTILKL